jgi:polysaccharide pyruvyl transferase CsaB
MTKKIVISGYYGFDNLGDEAILQAMIEAFREFNEELTITVLSSHPEITSSRYQVQAINRNKLFDIIKVVRDCDLFISGGGSLLQDVTGWKSILFYLGQVYLAQLLGKPTVLYAQGIGPVNINFNRRLICFVTNRAKLITVRDQDSRQLLFDYGVSRELIKTTIDPVFALADREWSRGKVLLEREGIDTTQPLIGISVRPWAGNGYLVALARTADYLTTITGGKVIIIPMYHEQDYPVGQELLELMQEEAFLLEQIYTPLEMLEIFSELELLIGVRLHSLIFAAIHSVPFIALNYDPKIESFIREIGVNSRVNIDEIEEGVLKRICATVWNKRKQFTGILTLKRNLFYRIARRDARKVLQLLED